MPTAAAAAGSAAALVLLAEMTPSARALSAALLQLQVGPPAAEPLPSRLLCNLHGCTSCCCFAMRHPEAKPTLLNLSLSILLSL